MQCKTADTPERPLVKRQLPKLHLDLHCSVPLPCRDLWRFDLTTNEWEQLPLRGGPSARSGHRMVYLKGGKALLFGGFYDTGRDVK